MSAQNFNTPTIFQIFQSGSKLWPHCPTDSPMFSPLEQSCSHLLGMDLQITFQHPLSLLSLPFIIIHTLSTHTSNPKCQMLSSQSNHFYLKVTPPSPPKFFLLVLCFSLLLSKTSFYLEQRMLHIFVQAA